MLHVTPLLPCPSIRNPNEGRPNGFHIEPVRCRRRKLVSDRLEFRLLLLGVGIVLIFSTGCTTTQSVADQAPRASMPVLSSVSSVVPRTRAWTEMTPNAAGAWEILPSGHPSGEIRVQLRAPYPSKLSIDDGQNVLREFDNTQSQGEGYFRINSINLSATQDTFDWEIAVTPPASRRVSASFRLNISNVSINPSYSGSDARSASAYPPS